MSLINTDPPPVSSSSDVKSSSIPEHITDFQDSLSSFLTEGRDPLPQLEPWSRSAFFDRVRTFKSSTWFAKPSWLSPVICARFGWKNVDTDLLQCVGCKGHFVGHLPASYEPAVYDACCERLEDQIRKTGHCAWCVWPGLPTPASLIEVGSSDADDDELTDSFTARVSKLIQFKANIPMIDQTKLSLSESDILSLIDVYKLSANSRKSEDCPDDDSEILKSACLLSLCGWEAEDSPSASYLKLKCSVCSRCSGLWNFRSISSSMIESFTDHGLSSENSAVVLAESLETNGQEVLSTDTVNPVQPDNADDVLQSAEISTILTAVEFKSSDVQSSIHGTTVEDDNEFPPSVTNKLPFSAYEVSSSNVLAEIANPGNSLPEPVWKIPEVSIQDVRRVVPRRDQSEISSQASVLSQVDSMETRSMDFDFDDISEKGDNRSVASSVCGEEVDPCSSSRVDASGKTEVTNSDQSASEVVIPVMLAESTVKETDNSPNEDGNCEEIDMETSKSGVEADKNVTASSVVTGSSVLGLEESAKSSADAEANGSAVVARLPDEIETGCPVIVGPMDLASSTTVLPIPPEDRGVSSLIASESEPIVGLAGSDDLTLGVDLVNIPSAMATATTGNCGSDTPSISFMEQPVTVQLDNQQQLDSLSDVVDTDKDDKVSSSNVLKRLRRDSLDQTQSEDSNSKRSRLDKQQRPLAAFCPVDEHYQWCLWVCKPSSLPSPGSASSKGKIEPEKPWLDVLHKLQKAYLSRQSTHAGSRRSYDKLRDMLHSWTSPNK